MGFFGVKKRHPYPSGQRSFGVKAIIDKGNFKVGSIITKGKREIKLEKAPITVYKSPILNLTSAFRKTKGCDAPFPRYERKA